MEELLANPSFSQPHFVAPSAATSASKESVHRQEEQAFSPSHEGHDDVNGDLPLLSR